jgi:hypothetical protein
MVTKRQKWPLGLVGSLSPWPLGWIAVTSSGRISFFFFFFGSPEKLLEVGNRWRRLGKWWPRVDHGHPQWPGLSLFFFFFFFVRQSRERWVAEGGGVWAGSPLFGCLI